MRCCTCEAALFRPGRLGAFWEEFHGIAGQSAIDTRYAIFQKKGINATGVRAAPWTSRAELKELRAMGQRLPFRCSFVDFS